MKKSDKLYVIFACYFWFVMSVLFFDTYLFIVLPLAATVWLFIGGKKHV